MKDIQLIAIGDLHGKDCWKTIVNTDDVDKFVFMGDYFDNYRNTPHQDQIDNFKEILSFKRANPEQVILLFGNHEFHYLNSSEQRYGGYQALGAPDISTCLHEALEENLLQMCYVHERHLFVHAGITKTWCAANNIDTASIEQSVNDLFKYKPNAYCFTPGESRNVYGDETCQSPLWVRPRSLLADRIEGYTQVVGHTEQDKIVITDEIILIDTLEAGQLLLIAEQHPFVLTFNILEC